MSTSSRQSVIFFTSQSHFYTLLTPGTTRNWHDGKTKRQH